MDKQANPLNIASNKLGLYHQIWTREVLSGKQTKNCATECRRPNAGTAIVEIR